MSVLVLVDGNSTDGTVEVAKRLRPGIRIVLQTGRGIPAFSYLEVVRH